MYTLETQMRGIKHINQKVNFFFLQILISFFSPNIIELNLTVTMCTPVLAFRKDTALKLRVILKTCVPG